MGLDCNDHAFRAVRYCICGIPDRSRCCSGIGLGDEVWTAVLFVVFELLAGQVLEPLRSVLCRSPLSTLRYSVPAKGRPSEDAQEAPEMSNKIALASLDFGGARSMCGAGKGVGADGPTISRDNDENISG